MEKENTSRLLSAEFPRELIKWRVGSLNKKQDKAIPLAYVDARDVMQRLDDVIGAENWSDSYSFYGDRIICKLSICINGEWISKEDGAGDTKIEGEKGGLSDAFKRAAVKWGVGRHLYSLKTKWMPVDDFKKLKGNPWDYLLSGKDSGQAAMKEFIAGLELRINNCKSLEEIESLLSAKDNQWLKRVSDVSNDNYQAVMDKYNSKLKQLGSM